MYVQSCGDSQILGNKEGAQVIIHELKYVIELLLRGLVHRDGCSLFTGGRVGAWGILVVSRKDKLTLHEGYR